MTDGAAARALYDETYENYRDYLNPPLARLMKFSGSPLEVSAEGMTIVDHNGKRYLDFAGGYGVFTLGHRHPRVLAAVRDFSRSGKPESAWSLMCQALLAANEFIYLR